ncbi:MAG TPA: hypothetical protein VG125_11540 [Pirellulales bacterium]|jgi:uncharacterized protein HemX|nr:hypothetical protein [Pirellulales bacterium]
MNRRLQFSLRALLVFMLAVACFFGGVQVERERQRREDQAAAFAARNAEREAALARIRQRMAFAAAERSKLYDRQAARREEVNRELAKQEKKVDRLLARLNALMAEEPDPFPAGQPLILPALPPYGGFPPAKDFPDWPSEKPPRGLRFD